MAGVDLVGLHCHLGSPLFDLEPYDEANRVMLSFAAEMVRKHGLRFASTARAAASHRSTCASSPAPPVEAYAEEIVSSFRRRCAENALPLPHLFVEPGRSLVARAGVALYTVGARKEIEGLRTWVSVDGGMADNIRPAMYDAKYEAVVVNRADDEPSETVTIAGKYCESGDILVQRRAAAAHGAGRRHRAAGIGRVLPDDGEQLQHGAEAGGSRRQGRPRAADPPPRDVRRLDGDGRVGGRVTANSKRQTANLPRVMFCCLPFAVCCTCTP